jgi:hypothetical protein
MIMLIIDTLPRSMGRGCDITRANHGILCSVSALAKQQSRKKIRDLKDIHATKQPR